MTVDNAKLQQAAIAGGMGSTSMRRLGWGGGGAGGGGVGKLLCFVTGLCIALIFLYVEVNDRFPEVAVMYGGP